MTGYFTVLAVLALSVPLLALWLDRRSAIRVADLADCRCGVPHDVDQVDWEALERSLAWGADGLTLVMDEVWPDGDQRPGGPL